VGVQVWAALEDGGHSICKIDAQHRSEIECFPSRENVQESVANFLVARYEDEEAHFVRFEPPSQELYMDVGIFRGSRETARSLARGERSSILHDRKAISGAKSIEATPPAWKEWGVVMIPQPYKQNYGWNLATRRKKWQSSTNQTACGQIRSLA